MSHIARPEGVYPRVCGGTIATAVGAAFQQGLSPRVRGNLARRRRADVLVGSIPARAGEPATGLPAPTRWWVYPRVCGGTCRTASARYPSRGLSPRVRGNRPQRLRPYTRGRSIPARAGEPRYGNILDAIRQVYPRACGGTWASAVFSVSELGLSPRVRGNRSRR